MAKIDPNNYIQYEAFCRKEFGALTNLQKAKVSMLKELDQLCMKCMRFPLDQMRCEGSRLIFQPDHSIDPNRLVYASCHKLDVKIEAENLELRMKAAGLPLSRRQKLVDNGYEPLNIQVEKKGSDLYFQGVRLHDLIYDKAEPALVYRVWQYVQAMVECGYAGVYFLTYDYYHAHIKQRPIEMLDKLANKLIECDWLAVDMLDYSPDIQYIRDSLFMAVKTRIAYCRPTMLLIAKEGPQWQTVEEKEFFEEAKKWKKFNLP